MKLVKIVWNDCWGDIPGWVTAEQLKEHQPESVTTIGYLIENHDVEGCTIVAGSVIGEYLGGVMAIRNEMIVTTQFLLDRK